MNQKQLPQGFRYATVYARIRKVEKDDLALLKAASIASEGKKLIIKVFIPKSVIHEIIQRKLTASGRAPGMPNGIAENIKML